MATWHGTTPAQCDLCECQLESAPFVDGATRHGPFAIMCLTCHKTEGTGLGKGKGQRYELKDGTYVKTAG